MNENGAVAFPANLSALTLDALTDLQTRAFAEFDTLSANPDIDETGVARLSVLADGIEALDAEVAGRRTEAQRSRASAADSQRERVGKLRQQQEQREAMTADTAAPEDPGEDEDEPAAEETPAEPPAPPAPPVTAGRRTGGARAEARTTSLAAAQERAPAVAVADRSNATITAAAPTSGIQVGQRLDDLDTLVAAFQSHSRSLAPTRGQPSFLTVASVREELEYVVDDRTSPRQFEDIARSIRDSVDTESLVAGGGWCAPSELKYDFFNILCQDGMVDLPEFGVNRGGVRFPVSPSLADVFTGTFTNATNPWVWTETDDILTVTGTPNKPCVRVPCPSFSEVRLECYGICLTAGNLTDNAYPESTKNHIKLLMGAHYHAMNQRYLAQMQTLSTFAGTVTGGGTATGDTIWSDAPTAVGIAAQDIRTRFGLCDDDVLEVIFPRWVKDAMKSDVGRRSGVDPSVISDADVNAQFRQYRVRVQWVQDWQVRSSGQFGGSTPLLAWPLTVDFMIYPAGTVMRGNGMNLDLGVVRDSVLNAENDFTAAWTEQCHLIALIGHQIRRYTVPVCAGGKVGGVYTNCHTA